MVAWEVPSSQSGPGFQRLAVFFRSIQYTSSCAPSVRSKPPSNRTHLSVTHKLWTKETQETWPR